TVATEASAAAGIAPGSIPGVFATSNGDGAVVGALLETLASTAPQVSPTQFHNSVHNAAAGYWTIATHSCAPVTCLSGHDGSFAAGLLRAAAEVCGTCEPVLLVAYDLPVPEPMTVLCGTRFAFATALVLAPVVGVSSPPAPASLPALMPTLAGLVVAFVAAPAPPDRVLPRRSGLHDLAAANPAARSLRLLEALATGRADRLSLPLFDGRVDVGVQPCSTPGASAR
ncbi:MAG: beta-ketoacyl synthase chain length factor, partial [Acetobacteraceae bacterium]